MIATEPTLSADARQGSGRPSSRWLSPPWGGVRRYRHESALCHAGSAWPRRRRSRSDLRESVLGVSSLFIWALILIVTVKYVTLLMRADNKGEGGILSLVVLVETLLGHKRGFVLGVGIVGAAFFFGDAMITPAISVVSASRAYR